MEAATGALPSRYTHSRRLFLRGVGLVYLVAFLSIGSQILGLIGSHGIWPAADFVARAKEQLGPAAFYRAPTLYYFGISDALLSGGCVVGAGLSVLLIVGVAPLLLLLLLWALYLSLSTVGGPFMSFQWDTLLLESGLVAAVMAPFDLRHPLRPLWRAGEPGWIAIFVEKWLLFRLMVLSGLVKLTSGDLVWRQLDALDFHYYTQPLPNLCSYYVHHFPHFLRPLSTVVMFAIELGAPLLLFFPRRTRHAGALALIALQLLIAATGNYGFFNLLTIVLCIPALDDELLHTALRRIVPARFSSLHTEKSAAAPSLPPAAKASWVSRAGAVVYGLIAVVWVVLGGVEGLRRVGWEGESPAFVDGALAAISGFRSINSYGLFAVMTTSRPEIIVEGSSDGQEWRAYEFRDKPGRLDERPRFSAPHMPRLDWQMWFAALGTYRHNPWYMAFLRRVLEGEPLVLALLDGNPFPQGPPKYLRSTLYHYRFATPEEHARTGDWWSREEVGSYAPTVTLDNGQLVAAKL